MTFEEGCHRVEVATEYVAGFALGVCIGLGYNWWVPIIVGYLLGRITGRYTAERIKRWRASKRSKASMH